ncbi:MAG: carboxypeptidase regulatory-like domain-containing protein, partial [Gemmatimonadales bacterium]
MANVPPGQYDVMFDTTGLCQGGTSLNYLVQWFDGQAGEETANPVEVFSGVPTVGVNASLQPGGIISGTVTGTGGTPVAGVCVYASLLQDGSRYTMSSSPTAADGTYRDIRLPAGDYLVQFDPTGCASAAETDYLTQWYDGQSSALTADTVPVAAGETVGSIDATLVPGGTIAGVVTDAGAAPVSQLCVEILDSSYSWITDTTTAADGSYSVPRLEPGDYYVRFDPTNMCWNGSTSAYAMEWWNGKWTEAGADPVSVTSGVTADSIDAVMLVSGSISGTVTDTQASPLAGICVNAYTTGESWVEHTTTAENGSYTLGNLAPIDYLVQFDASAACTGGTD